MWWPNWGFPDFAKLQLRHNLASKKQMKAGSSRPIIADSLVLCPQEPDADEPLHEAMSRIGRSGDGSETLVS